MLSRRARYRHAAMVMLLPPIQLRNLARRHTRRREPRLQAQRHKPVALRVLAPTRQQAADSVPTQVVEMAVRNQNEVHRRQAGVAHVKGYRDDSFRPRPLNRRTSLAQRRVSQERDASKLDEAARVAQPGDLHIPSGWLSLQPRPVWRKHRKRSGKLLRRRLRGVCKPAFLREALCGCWKGERGDLISRMSHGNGGHSGRTFFRRSDHHL